MQDVPGDLAAAISHAYTIISWYEVYTKDEIPPQWMWHLDHELEDWFDEVQLMRNQKLDPDSSSDDEPVVMERNEYAARMREG